MLPWTFWTYVGPTGRNHVQSEIDRYHDDDRESFSRAVAHLAVTPQSEWHLPHARKLAGRDKLHEVRYRANRNATRAVGRFMAHSNRFVIAVLCHHKQDVYQPVEALAIAAKRADQVEAGAASVARLQVDGEDFPPDD